MSHDPSQIILICWLGAEETFCRIINVENSWQLTFIHAFHQGFLRPQTLNQRMTYNKPWIHFADSQVSQVLLHSHTNIPHLHDYTEHACKDAILFFKLFHNIPWCFYVILYSIYNICQVDAPKAAVLRALGDVLMSLRWTDSPELFTLTQTLSLQLVLWGEETGG